MKPMKIGVICSEGGHLTEVQQLMPALEGHDLFFVTYDGPRGQALRPPKYLFKDTGQRPLRLLLYSPRFLQLLLKEKPDVLISTGAEIAIPFFYFARMLGIHTIFIESWCRTTTASVTARVVYPVAGDFLVQWPSLLKRFGRKARHEGAVI